MNPFKLVFVFVALIFFVTPLRAEERPAAPEPSATNQPANPSPSASAKSHSKSKKMKKKRKKIQDEELDLAPAPLMNTKP